MKSGADNPKYRILSGSALKTIALVTMLIDHITVVILSNLPWATESLMTVGSQEISWYYIGRLIGRIAFPIYCFLIAEGYAYTKNKRKYGMNLLCFAVVSEIPWNLENSGQLFYETQNVFFTLFLGFLAIEIYEKLQGKPFIQLVSLLGLLIISGYCKADYGVRGVGLIVCLYVLRNQRIIQTVTGCCFFTTPWRVMPGFVLLNFYNGKRGFIKGKFAKYLFYSIYPMHILLLYFIKLKYFGY